MPPAYTANDLLTLSRGYMEARVLLTATQLDLFTRLADGPHTAADLAGRMRADQRALTMLLDALAGMKLLRKRDDRYQCPPDVAVHLSAHSAASIVPMLLHHAGLWDSWSDLTAIVRGNKTAREHAHGPRDAQQVAAFINAMHVVGRARAVHVADAIDASQAHKLLDVGGATGTYSEALLKRWPQLKATVFDLPDVIPIARVRIADAEILDRVRLVAGDFYADELPAGHDLALLSAIIHQNSREQNVALYGKVFRALVPGGRLIVRDHVLSPNRTEPRGGTLFAINMLVRTAGGNCYTFDEIRADLEQAGFERVSLLRADTTMDGLIEAYKPAK